MRTEIALHVLWSIAGRNQNGSATVLTPDYENRKRSAFAKDKDTEFGSVVLIRIDENIDTSFVRWIRVE